MRLIGLLHVAGLQCAAAGRPSESVTLWTARAAQHTLTGLCETVEEAQYWQAPLRDARKVLRPQRFAAAEKRGAAMTLAAATEFARLATSGETPLAAEPAASGPAAP